MTNTILFIILVLSNFAFAQTTSFRYEGRLQGATIPPTAMAGQSFTVSLRRADNCGTNLGLTAWTSPSMTLMDGAFSISPTFTASALASAMNPNNNFGAGCSVPYSSRQLVISWSGGETFYVDLEDAPRANLATHAINAEKIGNVAVKANLACVANQILKFNSVTSQLECQALAATDIPVLSASQVPSLGGGDVTGTYGAMSVERIRGTNVVATAPTLNQVLKFDGTNWVPSADSTGTSPGDASYSVKGLVQVDTSLAASGINLVSGVLSLPNVITAGGPTGGAQTVPVITYDAKGRLTAVTAATIDDTTKLPLLGGTMSGPINMGNYPITNAASVSATSFSGRNFVANDNDTNTITVSSPANIAANYTLTLPTTDGSIGEVLSTDGAGVLSWVASGGGGSVTNVTSSNLYMTVATGSSTPALTLNIGQTANTVAAGDDNRFALALQTSVYDSDIAPITGPGACTATQTTYWNGVSGTWACQNIGTVANAASSVNFSGALGGDVSGTQTGTLVDKLKGKTISAGTTAGQIMIYDGSAWLNNVVSGDATLASSGALTLANSGATAATYKSVTVDVKGRVTAGTNPTTLSGFGITDAVQNAGGTPSFTTGTEAARPAPGTTGRIYLTSDTFRLYRDNGIGWNQLNTNASDLSGTVAVAAGGTGQTTYTDGQILIGNTVGNTLTKATLTAGTGVTITNGSGAITINATSGGGTVTSVGVSVPSYMTSSGGPVSSAGTIALDFGSQTAKKVFAAPQGAAGVPSFRALTIADVQSSFAGSFLTGTGCAAGQALTYISATDTITCSTIVPTITNTSNLASAKIWVGDATNKAQEVSISGDGTLTNTGALTLASTVSAGGVGSASLVPTINYDAKGRITSTSSAAYQDATAAAKGVVQVGSNLTVNSGTISLTGANAVAALGFTPFNKAGDTILNLNGSTTGTIGVTAPSTFTSWNMTLPTSSGTPGQVLSTNGSGITSWITPSGSSSFSGLTDATASNTVNNGSFAQTWNWPTATTVTPMTIAANTLSTGSILSLSTSSAAINSTGGLLKVANTSATTTGTLARFQANSTAGSGMTILANGNVGIGTTTPAWPLEVNGLIKTNGSGYGLYHDSGTVIMGTYVGGGHAEFGSFSNHKLAIQTNSIDAITILPNQKVGIGTATPTAVLNLKAGTAATNSAPLKLTAGVNLTTPEAGAVEYDGTNLFYTDSTNARRTIATSSSSYGDGSTIRAGTGAVGTPSLSFSGDTDTGFYSSSANTIGVSAGGANIFNLSSLGIFSPTTGGAAISMANGTATAPTYSFAGDSDTGWFRPAADTMAASTAGAERMRIDASGNVGIGSTATPAYKLEVSGDVNVIGGNYRVNGVPLGGGITSLGGQTGSPQTFASGVAGLAPSISSNLNVHTLNVPLASGSGVTSGTISKTDYDSFVAKLDSPLTAKGDLLSRGSTTHVRVPVGADGQVLSADSSQTSGLKWVAGPAGTYLPLTGGTINGSLTTSLSTLGSVLNVNQTGSGHAANFTGGNVGIGTTNPISNLHIQAPTAIQNIESTSLGAISKLVLASSTATTSAPHAALEFLNTSSGDMLASIESKTGNSTSTGALAFSTTSSSISSEKMRIAGNGNVGIGVTNPVAALDIYKSIQISTGSISGISVDQTIDSSTTAGANETPYGISSKLLHFGTGTGNSASYTASYGRVDKNGSGMLSAATGLSGYVQSSNTGAVITTAKAVTGRVLASGTGAVTTAYGGDFGVLNSSGTGNINTAYGVYISNVQATSAKYSLYASDPAAPSVFVGSVGIGTTTPASSSILDISSTTKGVVLPRMTKAQRDAIVSPIAGMAIYQTDFTPGLRVYNGANWMRFTETMD